MQDSYIINNETVAVISCGDNYSKVIENDRIISVKMSSYDILDLSCKYFGSSLLGRIEGSKFYLGSSYKVPILVDESRMLLFFSTRSHKMNDTCWIAYKKVDNYRKDVDGVKILFDNQQILNLNETYAVFENQYLRAQKLYSKIQKLLDTSIK